MADDVSEETMAVSSPASARPAGWSGLEPDRPVVGVLSHRAADPADDLAALVAEAELARRLDGFAFCPLEAIEVDDTLTLTPRESWDLGPWGPARVDGLAGEIDVVAVVGDLDERWSAVVDRFRERDVEVIVLGCPETAGGPETGGQPRLLPPVALLADRVYDDELLERRRDYLRLVGGLPPAGGMLLAAVDRLAADPRGHLERVLIDMARGDGLELVVASVPGRAPAAPALARRIEVIDPLDLVAAIQDADLLLTDQAAAVAIGVALGRPTVAVADTFAVQPQAPVGPGSRAGGLCAWLADHAVVIPTLSAGELPTAAAAPSAADRRRVQDLVDRDFDALADRLREAVRRRSARRPVDRSSQLAERVRVLEAAHAGVLRRLRAERIAFGQAAAPLLRPPVDDDHVRLWLEIQQLRASEAMVRAAVEQQGREAARIQEDLHASRAFAEAVRAEWYADVRDRVERAARELEVLKLQRDNEVSALTEEARLARAELDALYRTRTMRALRPLRRVYGRVRGLRP